MNQFQSSIYKQQPSANQLVLKSLLLKNDANHFFENSILETSDRQILIQDYIQKQSNQYFEISNTYEQICKKLRIGESFISEPQITLSRTIGGIKISTDQNLSTDFFKRDWEETVINFPLIMKKLKQENLTLMRKKKEELKQFRQRVNIKFYFESQKPVPYDLYRQGKKTQSITVKSDLKDGIQVTGCILTREGYKLIFPNIANIIRDHQLVNEQSIVIKDLSSLRVKGNMVLEDQMNDLKFFIWKFKQFKQFFKVLLKKSINNIEIEQVLKQVALSMKTSVYHTMTFYQISSKCWNLPRLIKELSKKGLFPRERNELFEEIIGNIQEDLSEMLQPVIQMQDEWIPIEESHISFELYKQQLSQIISKRTQ